MYRSNNKSLDLSQPIRLSGLSSGAKLQAVLLSRSPSVVSVALQLPEPESGVSSRLMHKFPSTTTLWLLLRHFESGSTGSTPSRNFTARGLPQMEGEASGSGRLFYETPVIQVMGRELATFTDLQKSLAQLGFNSGSVLLRLGFRRTETPLEEAIEEIDGYFKSVGGEHTGGAHAPSIGNAESAPAVSGPVLAEAESEQMSPPEPRLALERNDASNESSTILSPSQLHPDEHSQARPESISLSPKSSLTSEPMITGPSHRLISVIAPSSASTPAAARQAFNEKDYEPSIAHAILHQARLASSGVNKRLPTDAELLAEAEAQARKNADIGEVNIKVRFPDQMQVTSTFSNLDTASSLYEFIKGLMERGDEHFSLKFSSAQGPKSVPKQSHARLIGDLGMTGRVLVNFVWDDGVDSEARGGRILKQQYQQKAKEIEVKEIEGLNVEEGKDPEAVEGKGKQSDGGKERKGGIPKWLKLPGKK